MIACDASGDLAHDPGRITSDTVNHRRRHRMQKVQTNEIQTALTLDDAAAMSGAAVVLGKDR